MRTITKFKEIRGLVAALALPLILGGCDSLLSVNNPSIIEEGELDDPELVDALVNGVTGEFQRMYGSQALYAGILSDELIDGHTYRPHRPFDERKLDPTESLVGWGYSAVHRARGAADSLSTRIRSLLGDEAGTSLALARTLAYGGYSYTVMGEQFCRSPIDGSEPYSTDELLEMAVQRFDEAISIAEAAKGAGENAASADSLINLARVGAARASLQAGATQQAIDYASAVPETFEFWIAHSDNSGAQYNDFHGPTTGSSDSRWVGIDPAFEGLGDERIPHSAERLQIMDTRSFFIPFQPRSFSGWEQGSDVAFERATDLRFASGLEARYILAEAGDMTDAELETFINERRQVGGQSQIAAGSLSRDELMAELRDQRRRDFFLDGHRLGDLRRYKAQYGIDAFPSGTYPQTESSYGDSECYPIADEELNSNPNV